MSAIAFGGPRGIDLIALYADGHHLQSSATLTGSAFSAAQGCAGASAVWAFFGYAPVAGLVVLDEFKIDTVLVDATARPVTAQAAIARNSLSTMAGMCF